MLFKEIGIDMGTENTRICMKNKGIILSESSLVSVTTDETYRYNIGNSAKSLLNKVDGVVVLKPFITDFDLSVILFQGLLKKAFKHSKYFFNLVISMPSNASEIERRAIFEMTESVDAIHTYLVPEVLLAALGSGFNIEKPCGVLVIHIGGSKAEIAVCSLGEVVAIETVKCGGEDINNALIDFCKKKYKVQIGYRTAEKIKRNVGFAYRTLYEKDIDIKCRKLDTGVSSSLTLTSVEVRTVISNALSPVIEAVKNIFQKVSADLVADIMSGNIVLTGGTACLYGVDKLIEQELRLDVSVSENPDKAVIRGIEKMLNENLLKKDIYKKVDF